MTDQIAKAIDNIEADIQKFERQAQREISATGRASIEAKNAVDKLCIQQMELAERLARFQNVSNPPTGETLAASDVGKQVINSQGYKEFMSGVGSSVRIDVQNNTLTSSNTTAAPGRLDRVIPGASAIMTMEKLIPAVATESNAIEFTREAAFTNSAAETAEGSALPESAQTYALVNMPVSTVAHWLRISKQLAQDNRALSAYVNNRLIYGLNRRVETQLVAGNGAAPNISGILASGNYQPHGYTAAQLGAVAPKLTLIRRCIADLSSLGFNPSAIILHPADLAAIEVAALQAEPVQLNLKNILTATEYQARLFNIPVVASAGMAVDTFAVGDFMAAAMIHNRQDATVELSESDSDNFTKNLITVRAERRLALTTYTPFAIIGGDLTPA